MLPLSIFGILLYTEFVRGIFLIGEMYWSGKGTGCTYFGFLSKNRCDGIAFKHSARFFVYGYKVPYLFIS